MAGNVLRRTYSNRGMFNVEDYTESLEGNKIRGSWEIAAENAAQKKGC